MGYYANQEIEMQENFVKKGKDKMPCGATYDWERDETPGFRDHFEVVKSTKDRCKGCMRLTMKNDNDYCDDKQAYIVWEE